LLTQILLGIYPFELAAVGGILPSTRNGIINLHMNIGWYLLVLSAVMVVVRFLAVLLRLPVFRFSRGGTLTPVPAPAAGTGAALAATRPPPFIAFLLAAHWFLIPFLFSAQYITMMYSRPLAAYTGIDRLAIKGAHKPLALTCLAVNILLVGYRQYEHALRARIEQQRRDDKDD
jgi:hypothetical protein